MHRIEPPIPSLASPESSPSSAITKSAVIGVEVKEGPKPAPI